MTRRSILSAPVAWTLLLTVTLAALPASAGVLADFLPQPASASIPEFIWSGQALTIGPGAIGDGFGSPGAGDGHLPLASQNIPGLQVSTPFTVPGVPGGQVNSTTGATMFFNATLQIIPQAPAAVGFVASGPAGAASGYVVQPLGPAIVNLWSTDPFEAVADVENPVLLLSGTVSNAFIAGLLGASTGTTLSASVTYTGGAILAATPWTLAFGDFSWSLLDILAPLQIDSRTGLIAPFVANGVGQFTASNGTPEPATLSVLVIGAVAVALRRRRR